MVNIINLFYCRSLIRLNKQYKIQCYWFCVDREEPIFPYEKLIVNYDPNNEDFETTASSVDELFTQQEIELLQDYLETRGVELEVKKAENLPVDSNYLGQGFFPIGGGSGLIELNKNEGCNLPFKVQGNYDYKDLENLVYCPEE
ncbi:hypothetical protein [Desulfosporosinus nitroreducens]|uniref:Uncharacterized protein n=1 Tax=Desulfosporosinus nitroreducens TaxID=2018668 RepID=A0ABT8QP82_9FIRM|nr:hypothetical protein [Desulfosporosinus nitroreducens]MDO0823085.1 hypothetical protein [Desulfosporosinus nitroreducens]